MTDALTAGGAPTSPPEIPPEPSKSPPDRPMIPDPPTPQPQPGERPRPEVPGDPGPQEIPVTDPGPSPTIAPPVMARVAWDLARAPVRESRFS